MFVLSVLHEGDLPLMLCFVTNLVSVQLLSIVVFGLVCLCLFDLA